MAYAKDCYQPGETNINHYEAHLRRESGIIGLLIAVVTVIFLELVNADAAWYVLVFVPTIFAITEFLQARSMFCANYALRGIQNAARSIDEPTHVHSQSARELDKVRATRMLATAGLSAGFITLLVIIIFAF